MNIENTIIKSLIKETRNRDNLKEIDTTKAVAEALKKTRRGIFQNEIDYRFLLKDFSPLKTNNRSAVDILGFMEDKFNFVEYKLFDEHKPKSYHHWSAVWHLRSDIEKLAHAASFSSNYEIEFYFVFAVRNSKGTSINDDQLSKASNFIFDEKTRKPRILNFNQLTVLKTIESVCKNPPKDWGNWETNLKASGEDHFLIGKLK